MIDSVVTFSFGVVCGRVRVRVKGYGGVASALETLVLSDFEDQNLQRSK